MQFKKSRQPIAGPRDPNELLVEAGYRGLLNKAPDAQGMEFCLSALRNGLAWPDFLRNLLSWHEFEMPEDPTQGRVFELLRRERAALEQIDADVTIPLEVLPGTGSRLMLRGPVRDASVFWSIVYAGGVWEPNVTKFLIEYLGPGQVFIDVGANLGYFTVVGASSVGPAGRVISFEPARRNLEYLKRNVAINQMANIQVLAYALWDGPGTLSMTVPEDFLGGAHVNDSRSKASAPDAKLGDGAGAPGEAEALCMSLDDIVDSGEVKLDECRLLKIDIEGSEPFALDGMQKTLGRLRPAMVLEVNPHCLAFFGLGAEAIWDRLEALGYVSAVLPQPSQESVLSRLPVSGILGGSGLRQIQSSAVLSETLEECSSAGPAWFDLVALPKELAERD